MTSGDIEFAYLVYPPRQRTRYAKIVTFRISPELNELITVAARRTGKSKSEFIRDSVVEFVRFLETSLGAEVDLARYLLKSERKDKERLEESVVLL